MEHTAPLHASSASRLAAASRASSPSETAHSASAAAAVLSLGVSAVRGAHEPASSQTGDGAADSSVLSAAVGALKESRRGRGRRADRQAPAVAAPPRANSADWPLGRTGAAHVMRADTGVSPHSTASRKTVPRSTEPICGVPCDDAVTRIPSASAERSRRDDRTCP